MQPTRLAWAARNWAVTHFFFVIAGVGSMRRSETSIDPAWLLTGIRP
jgi:hypothetical protein